MGRRRIKIEKIENKNARYVCFSKRRQGLFKKAAEFSRLFDNVSVFCTVFSPAGKPFVFGDPPRMVLDHNLVPLPPLSSSSPEAESSSPPPPSAAVDDDLKYISGLSLSELEEYSAFLEETRAAVINKLENDVAPEIEPIVEKIHHTNTSNNNSDAADFIRTKAEEEAVEAAVIGYGAIEDYDELYRLLGDYDAIETTGDGNNFDLDQESVPISLMTTMVGDKGVDGIAHYLGLGSIGEEMADASHLQFGLIGEETPNSDANDSWMDELIGEETPDSDANDSWMGEMMANYGSIAEVPDFDFMDELLSMV